jgi:hypothetical protein
MRKLSIFLMLTLLLGFTTVAQADPTVLQMVNYMLEEIQKLNPISQEQLDTSLQPYETYAKGKYEVVAYGTYAGYEQNAYTYYPPNTAGQQHIITVSEDTSGKPYNFTINATQEWGLKGVTDLGGTFYSQKSLNGDKVVHWKLFCLKVLNLGPEYDIGFAAFEDLPNGGDFDYNDLVLKIEPNPPAVPLPGAVLLLGAGLARLAAYARRRQED